MKNYEAQYTQSPSQSFGELRAGLRFSRIEQLEDWQRENEYVPKNNIFELHKYF